jgi:hypothetical protein
MVAGGVAGFLSAREENHPNQAEGGKGSAVAGAIAGGFTLVGQVIGGIAALNITPQVLERYGFRAVNLVRDTGYLAASLGTALYLSARFNIGVSRWIQSHACDCPILKK